MEDATESDDERRKRLNREKSARHRARQRGADVPLRKTGPSRAPYAQTGEKICRDCGEAKPLDAFYLVGPTSRPHSYCRDCCNSRGRAHRRANPGLNAQRLRERYWANVEETRQKSREYRQRDPERARAHDRRRQESVRAKKLAAKYGLTVEQYAEMYQQQGGVCAICSQTDRQGHRLAVDHCHATGAVRGLLCHACNVAIGLLRDDPSLLDAASRYLRRPPAMS